MLNICVLDSGVNLDHKRIYPNRDKFILYDIVGKKIERVDNLDDTIGHGTAISAILSSAENVIIHCFKIFNNDFECDEEKLVYILKYIYSNIDCDIINLSLGVITLTDELYNICEKLYLKNIILVAALENSGLVSYPAAFSFVIGVDSHVDCVKNTDVIYVKNSDVVNVFGFGGLQRVAWVNPDFILSEGTSYAAAHVIKIILKGQCHSFREAMDFIECYADKCVELKEITTESKRNFDISKAVVFPHSKEIDCLINNSDKIPFDVIGIYDLKYSGKIGKNISHNEKKDIIIKNYDLLDWNEDFDTIIIGHLSEYSKRMDLDILEILLRNCEKYNKNIFSFDDLTIYEPLASNIKTYYPKPIKDFGNKTLYRMYYIQSPVLGVFGTSSSQGKFSLQLSIRKKMIDKGYNIGQLGSEPSSLLFGMDEVYPYGYDNSIKLNRGDNILYINELMHKIDSSFPDIILVGSQSNTTSYYPYNFQQLPVMQNEFLTATNPDYVVLCVNPFDEIQYISNTIKYIEGLCNCDVIALALFPFDFQNEWAKAVSRRKRISIYEQNRIIKKLQKNFKIKCFIIGNADSEENLVNHIIETFARGE